MPPPWEPAAKPARSHGGLEAFGSHTSHSLDGGIAYKPLTRGWVPFTRSGWVLFTLSKRVEPNGNDDGNSKVLADYAKSSCPVVLKGYTGKDDWTLEKIKNEVGGVFRDVRIGDYDTGQGDADSVSMQVSDFVDYLLGRSDFPQGARLVEGKGPYLANVPFPSLAKQLPISSFFPTAPENSLFWLGSESRTPLHCHQHCDVLLLQLVGRRKIVLVPPHQATFVGCVPRNYNVCTAAFDPFEPDREQFPGADVIHQLYYELEPGDALLIPGFWFHAVRLEEFSLAVSQFNAGLMPLAVGGGPRKSWEERAYMQGWG